MCLKEWNKDGRQIPYFVLVLGWKAVSLSMLLTHPKVACVQFWMTRLPGASNICLSYFLLLIQPYMWNRGHYSVHFRQNSEQMCDQNSQYAWWSWKIWSYHGRWQDKRLVYTLGVAWFFCRSLPVHSLITPPCSMKLRVKQRRAIIFVWLVHFETTLSLSL